MLPVATTRRTDHARTWQAAVVHVVGVLLLAVVGVALVIWSISADLADPAAWQQRLVELREEMPELMADRVFWAVVVGSVLVGEAIVCVAAWVFMAWGARDELVPQAFGASLRRLWIATPHAALVLLIGGLLTVPLERTHQRVVHDWLTTTTVEIPEALPETPEAAAELEADWQDHLAQQPWVARHAQGLQTAVQWLIGVWGLAVVLRVGAARPWSPRCRWPAVCDGCGHSLQGRMDRETCSECGLAVAASVGERARLGAPVMGVSTLGRAWAFGRGMFRGWWRCVWEPVRAPTRFGHALRAMHPEGGHRALLVVNALIVGVLSFAGTGTVTWIAGLLDGAHLARAVLVGVVLAMATIGLALVVASLVGSMSTRMTLSPLLPAAMQGACHLSGLVVGWVAVNLVVAVVLAVLGEWVGAESLMTGVPGTLLPMGLMVLNVTMLVVYLALLWRIVMAARFANW